jgi:hypothetical protein
VHASEIAPGQREFIALNARIARSPAHQPITRRKEPPADHADWAAVMHKRAFLQE